MPPIKLGRTSHTLLKALPGDSGGTLVKSLLLRRVPVPLLVQELVIPCMAGQLGAHAEQLPKPKQPARREAMLIRVTPSSPQLEKAPCLANKRTSRVKKKIKNGISVIRNSD